MEKQPQREPATFEEIWGILRETSEMQKENERERKKTEQLIKENARETKEIKQLIKDTDRLMQDNAREMKETDRRLKETDRLMQENARETKEIKQLIKDTDRQMKDTDRRMKKLQGLFDNQWGAFMESLVAGDLVALLQGRGIPVQETLSRRRGRLNGEHYEFDILAVNGEAVVVVEVKTTLYSQEVADFVELLGQFTGYLPKYRGKAVHGALAFLKADAGVQLHIARQGLFAIRATGDSARIVNEEGFRPRAFD